MREKDAVYTILFFFSCYTRKGMLCASAKFGAITKSKIPMQSIALRVRLACTTLTATPQNDASIIRGTPAAQVDA